MVSLPSGIGVKWLDVNGPAGLDIFLSIYNHPIAPCVRFTYGGYFNDTQTDISVEIYLDLLLPVD